ncbi:lachesin-like isoform X2 [Pecten maximus]|uniref:lachesin-like isoform X2 n=1 Tax=Pecten maximus TaxID=6579 RepID=UPI001459076A|nr:lachesin-like isoform X2 [Pecten maximus]
MLRRLLVLVVVMTLATESSISNSDIKLISAKPTKKVTFYCTKRSNDEVMLWKIKTKSSTTVEQTNCDDLESTQIDMRKRCVEESYGFDLVITKVSEDDEGIYECTAALQNDVLKVYDFRIEKEASIPEEAYTKDVTIREGDTAKLWCNATGYPIPSVQWQIVETDSNGRESIHDVGIQGKLLQIQNVSRHCSTSYRCVASNKSYRKQVTRNIKIRVDFGAMADLDIYNGANCGTTMDDLGEKIHVNSTGSHYVERKVGGKVSLVCSGSGSPNATIEWLRYHQGNLVKISSLGHGDKIDNTNLPGAFATAVCPSLFKDERRFRLTFHTFDEKFTKYVCRALNEYGDDEMTITIKKST